MWWKTRAPGKWRRKKALIRKDNFALASPVYPPCRRVLLDRAREKRNEADRLELLAARLPVLDDESNEVLFGIIQAAFYAHGS